MVNSTLIIYKLKFASDLCEANFVTYMSRINSLLLTVHSLTPQVFSPIVN